jgi:nicotinate-nucleotide pyrophosphorylase (carboxylating)
MTHTTDFTGRAAMHDLRSVIEKNVSDALAEDLGKGDLTAELISGSVTATATIVTREPMVQAGRPWVDEICRRFDPNIEIEWSTGDGDRLQAGSTVARLRGTARALLSGERTALNFLQTLSATATVTAAYVDAVSDTRTKVLDTRKTIPGLRLAQKYAVRCGGGVNHRIGLFDAILIKENHIQSAGGIKAAIMEARRLHAGLTIEIEVESIDEMRQALRAGAERLLLDNFTAEQLREAVALNAGEGTPPALLEASGGLTMETARAVAGTGVDFISVGALTKNVRAIDLSMRFD